MARGTFEIGLPASIQDGDPLKAEIARWVECCREAGWPVELWRPGRNGGRVFITWSGRGHRFPPFPVFVD